MASIMGRLFIRILCLITLVYGVNGNNCTEKYPFKYCPREQDKPDQDTCCEVNGEFKCCTGQEVLESWAKWLIAIAVIVGVVLIASAVCCCCGWCVLCWKCCKCCCGCLCCCCKDDDDEKTSLTA